MRCFILRTFGDKNTFAIQYEFDVNPFNETSLIGETWGKFELSVRGIDICRYKRADSETTYQWNLIYIVEWFSENLKYILSEEPFPSLLKDNTHLNYWIIVCCLNQITMMSLMHGSIQSKNGSLNTLGFQIEQVHFCLMCFSEGLTIT